MDKKDDENQDSIDSNGNPIIKQTGIDKWFNVLLCRSDLNNETLDTRPVSFSALFKYGSQHDKILVWIGIVLAMLAGILQPLSMFFAGKIADILIIYGNTPKSNDLWDQGFEIVLINTIVGLLLIIVTFAQYFCLKIACQNITANLRSRFIASMLRQDSYFYDTHQLGAINSQLNERITAISVGIGENIGLLIRGVFNFLTTIALSFFVSWKITVVMILVGPISCLTMSFMARMIGRASKKQNIWSEKASNILQESIMHVETVQSSNGQNQMIQKLSDVLKNGRIHGIFTYFWNGFFDGLFFLFLYIFYGFGLCYGAVEFYYGRINAGDVLIVTNAILVGSYLLGFISPQIMTILKARVAAALIYNRIERVPDIDCYSNEGVISKDPKGHIQFENVDFEYPNRRCKVLKDLSFEVKAGQTIALVGHSGSGKSSCVSLLTRLYDCTGGKIKIDGVNIQKLNIRHLRTLVSKVEQDSVLFSATIEENISMGDASIGKDRIEEACRIANAHNFILKLEHGYKTLVGFGGVQLSGGQRQRISIARAIVRDSPILILDESTRQFRILNLIILNFSALDAENEIIVQTALNEASKNRTTIIIAHRLSTLRFVEKIIVLSEGQVAETGSHEELIQIPDGLYAKLVNAQQFENTKGHHKEAEETVDLPATFESNSLLRSSVRSSIRDPTSKVPVFDDIDSDKPVKYAGLLRLYKHSKGHYGKLVAGTLFSILRGLELPAYVLLMDMVFVLFQHKEPSWDLYQIKVIWLFVASCGLALLCCFTIFGAVAFYGWAAEEVSDKLKIEAFTNILRQGAAYFDNPQTSNAKLLKRIGADSISIKAGLDNRLYHLVNNVFCAIIEVVMAFFYSIQISIVGTVMYSILSAILWFLTERLRHSLHNLHLVDDSAKFAVEIIENARSIQQLTQERYFLSKYEELLKRCRKWEFKIAVYDSITFSITQSSMYLSDSVCYGAGIYLVYYGYNDPIQVFVSCRLWGTLSWALLFVSMSFVEIMHAIPACDSICELVETIPNLNDNESDGLEPEINGTLSIDRAVFAYPNRSNLNVLSSLTINVNKGETVALVGPSGGGKSSIFALLERFYELKSGELLIDKTPVHNFKLSYLRSQMAIVGQDPVLFTGTIKENICLGYPNATIEEITEACRLANIQDFIERLPNGYETEIGQKQLSGGQKQRISIARCLVKKPAILLLDEATSSLDAESERHVQKALEAASQNRSCLVIAHRLSSIEKADKIYFIADGRVKESGTHDELLSKDGLYADMIRKQILQT